MRAAAWPNPLVEATITLPVARQNGMGRRST